jgi:hypothetical protein
MHVPTSWFAALGLLCAACGAASTASPDAGPLAPDAASSPAPDAAPGPVPDAASDAAPSPAPDAASDAAPAPTPDAAAPPPADARVLILGNSYVFVGHLDAALAALSTGSPAPLRVSAYARGGYRLAQHLTDLETPGSELATLFADGCGGADPWDFVVLQEQSQIPGFPPGQPERDASVVAAGELARHVADCGARTAFFVTWGRRDGDADNPGLFPDFATMQAALDTGYAAIAQAAAEAVPDAPPPLRLPVGPAFGQIAAGPDGAARFPRLYAPDGSHPSALGTYLAAAVFHRGLTGTDPLTLTDTPADLAVEDRAALLAAAAEVEMPAAP